MESLRIDKNNIKMPYDLANANQVKTPSSKFYSLVVESKGNCGERVRGWSGAGSLIELIGLKKSFFFLGR